MGLLSPFSGADPIGGWGPGDGYESGDGPSTGGDVPSALGAAADNTGPARDFLQNDDGDIAVVNGDFSLVRGAAAVRQGIPIRVRTFLNECFLDGTVGVPWLEQILIKNFDPLVVRELIGQAIASVPDVTQVVGADLQLDRTTRTGSISYTVRTKYSATPISGTFPAL